jgi:hypothetical protein
LLLLVGGRGYEDRPFRNAVVHAPMQRAACRQQVGSVLAPFVPAFIAKTGSKQKRAARKIFPVFGKILCPLLYLLMVWPPREFVSALGLGRKMLCGLDHKASGGEVDVDFAAE